MINEDVSNRLVTLEMRVSERSAKIILSQLKALLEKAKESGGNLSHYISKQVENSQVPLKDLVGKGQLESIPIKSAELKELKRELNQLGVAFSVMKDKKTKDLSVFFQARDLQVFDHAFKTAVKKAERKASVKASTLKQIRKFQDKLLNQDQVKKVKHKHQEQSL
ncbi:TPA: PcfB family protein [Streptococcus suis]